MNKYILASFLIFTPLAEAGSFWTSHDGREVKYISPGGAGVGKTFLELQGVEFSGCVREDGVVLESSSKDYKELFSLILSAQLTGKKVRVRYETQDNCQFGKVTSAYIIK